MVRVTDSCVTCGTCVNECPVGAITIDSGKAYIDNAKCLDYKTCVQSCPLEAIKIEG